jgi:hypothetical protein
MLGVYEAFPENIHLTENFTSYLPRRQLQQKIVQVFQDLNRKKFSFEDIGSPSVPQCTIIFEIGIADSRSFNYLNAEETSKVLNILRKESLDVMDFFCVMRYYMIKGQKKTPLKFDYYMIRSVFGEKRLGFQVFHERGPRYISPQDVIAFFVDKANETSEKRILKLVESA